MFAATVVVAGAVCLWPEIARADDTTAAQAEALIREGVRLRHERKDDLALPNFQKAYDLLHSPRTEGQLGLVEMAVGYWLESEQHLAGALESPEHPWVIKNRSALDQALAEVRLSIGEIALTGAPDGATVFLNGRPVGRLPLPGPVRAPKGKAEIELRAPGYATVTRNLRVAGNDRQALAITLDRESATGGSAAPVAMGQPSPPAPGAVPPGASEGQPVAQLESERQDGGGGLRRRLAWGAAAAALGAVAFGVVETVLWQGKRSDFSNHRAPTSGGATPGDYDCFENRPERGGPGCASLYDSAHSAQRLAIVGYAAAGALALTSAFLFRHRARDSTAGEHAFACAPTLLGATTSVTGTAAFGCNLIF